MYLYGIDIGGTTIKIGLFNNKHKLLDKWEIKTDISNKGKNIISDIINSVEQYNQKNNINNKDIDGLGFGVPGPVVNGVVNQALNLGWDKFNLVEEIKKITNIQNIVVANDANLAAAGEVWAGSGKDVDSLVMFTLGTGVGGGVIFNKQIVEGHNGSAGEIGHIIVNRDSDNLCSCGNYGCLETYSSATGIVNNTIKILNTYEEESSLRNYDEITAKLVFEQAKAKDPLALKAVNKLCEYIGFAASIVAVTNDPELFIIGGGVSNAGDILLEGVKRYYSKYAFHAVKDTKFKIAQLGNDAGIYGAAYLALINKKA